MAIYQGGRGIAFQGGGNSMFDQISQAQQRVAELKQLQKEEDFLDKINKAGQLGKTDAEFYNPEGKLKLGQFKSWKEHYNDITGGKSNKELRKAFGRTATPEVIEQVLKKKSDERDRAVLSAITRKMNELGTNNIYKVIDKDDPDFNSWYNSILNPEIRTELIKKYGFQPGQKEEFLVPDWLEKRRAKGKGLSEIAVPAAIGTAGAVSAFNALAPNVKDSGAVKWVQKRFGYNPGEAREILRAMQTGERPRNLSSKISAKKKLIERLSNQKKKLSARDSRRLGQAKRFLKDFEAADKNWRESSKKILQQANKGRVVGSGLGLLRQVGGYNIGKTLAEQATDNQIAQEVAGFGGSVALPKLMDAGAKRAIATWAPRLLANAGWIGGPKGRALTGLLSVGLGYGLDKLLSDD